MKFLKSSSGILFIFLTGFLLFASCSKDEKAENAPSSIILEASKSSIAADGSDIVNFTVTVYDEYEKTLTATNVEIYLEDQALESNSFSTSQTGTYHFQAKINGIKSNSVTVVALSEQDLKVASIVLKSNTQVMIANGQSVARLEVEFKDATGNILEDVNYLLSANEENLTGLNFKTNEYGSYDIIASVNGKESNTININAREDIQYEEISIPVVFHIVHVGEPVGEGSNFSATIAQGLLGRINKGLSNDFDADNPNAVDTKIRFRMATIGENGSVLSEPGINRIDGRTYDLGSQNRIHDFHDKSSVVYNKIRLDIENLFENGDVADDNQFGRGELDYIASQEHWDMHYYHNIILAPLHEEVYATGYARYPVMSQPDILEGLAFTTSVEVGEKTNSDKTICVVDSESITYVEGNYTIIHETGHVLGLRHLFSQNDCESSDYCTDTYSYKSGDLEAACDDNRGVTYRDNLMSFSPTKTNFTYEQRERMRKVLEYAYYLRDLKNSDR